MPEATGEAGGQPAQQDGQGKSIFRTIIQGLAVYMAMQFAMKQFMGGPKTTTVRGADGNTVQVTTSNQVPPYSERPAHLDEGATYNHVPQHLAPIWPENSAVDIVVAVSPSVWLTPLKDLSKDAVVFEEKQFRIGNWTDKRTAEGTIYIPTPVQHNGTLWGHFYVGLSGALLDPTQRGYDPGSAYHFVYPLTQYIPKKKEAKTRSLLGDATETAEELAEQVPEHSGPIIANYYHPNVSLSFIPNSGVISLAQAPPAVSQFLRLEATGARDGSGQNSWYYPMLFVNNFWQLKSHMTQLNDTVQTMPIRIDLNNLADWKFKTMASIDMSGKESARQAAYGNSLPGGGDGSEIEMIKEIFIDTNPILLGITIVVSIAHMILETLAFGSDIAHYRKKKDNVGISVRSILANVFMQGVIFLYLIDQSQNTSWMILGGQAVGILIELWKITTVVNVRVRAAPGSIIPYRISFEDKHKLSETEEKTKEYDEIAFKYMYVAGVPLLLAYAAYSLLYETHKSWYSYIIATLVGSVYAYGFLMMVPSLYINYRLKSVAHMPGKAMMYKFLNTFIDDLFAFTIKMPFLHRLATLRDDVIFFIYMYQRWAYKIDYTRVNEFGQGGDDEDESEKVAEKKAEKKVEKKAEKKGEKKGEKKTLVLGDGSCSPEADIRSSSPPAKQHSSTAADTRKRPFSQTVGTLLAAIATCMTEALRILMFADKRQWGPDEFEQTRVLEEALDEAKKDFQEMAPLVHGQFYYETDRTPESLQTLQTLLTKFQFHTRNFKDWARQGGAINPVWARETAQLRADLHRAQCRAASRIFAAEQDAPRCLGAMHVYRQLKRNERDRDREEGGGRGSLEALVPSCNAVGRFRSLGESQDVAFVCDFCEGYIVWPDLQSMPAERTPLPPTAVTGYPHWQAKGVGAATGEDKMVVFAPLAIANHMPPEPGEWQAGLMCPHCEEDTYLDAGANSSELKYVQDEKGFADLEAFRAHLEWYHTAMPVPPISSLASVLPSAASNCTVM
ncbi:cleft lip and palate transmembrane protein 1-domain-containing protein [Chaetomidium leptoderma]|uniref:Cleft lip and palate transmembrane protein 1-domain-containing protein n=1 Tax=Chaetomidium leptoderma TaxID=669021 RepID=A0AAN6VUJ3_9PEZI|nr:cleft lip and palate transmembrane protein 1-domain-containing protein [Chaetomidium leptoderma]